MSDQNPNPARSAALRIGLLLCDDVPEDGRHRFGDYLGMFDRGITAVDANIRLTPYECYKNVFPANVEDQDGYLISGSGASVFEDLPWIQTLMQFVRDADAVNKKVVGICFGHQLIAHALGGHSKRSDNGWGFGIHSAHLDRQPAWLRAKENSYRLIVIHQDQVETLPPGFRNLASNDFCPYSMITNDRNMLGIQGHPEFNKEYCAYRAEFRRELLGEVKYRETMELLSNHEIDSPEVLGWVSSFFRAGHDSTPAAGTG